MKKLILLLTVLLSTWVSGIAITPVTAVKFTVAALPTSQNNYLCIRYYGYPEEYHKMVKEGNNFVITINQGTSILDFFINNAGTSNVDDGFWYSYCSGPDILLYHENLVTSYPFYMNQDTYDVLESNYGRTLCKLTYYYNPYTINNGCIYVDDTSRPITGYISTPTILETIQESDVSIRVFQQVIYAKFEGEANIQLYDINGRTILIDRKEYEFESNPLNPGVYILVVNNKTQRVLIE